MALSDTTFLFFWLIAIGVGQRFLERPGPWRAISLGLGVGVAQLFKYNGWISGVIVAASAVTWMIFHPEQWRARSALAIWGWGLVAAGVAALVYWPWFAFVDSHGGYSALLAHQRGYLGGWSSWPGHWWVQLAQNQFLSGGPTWGCWAGGLAALGMEITAADGTFEWRVIARLIAAITSVTALWILCGSLWWLTLAWILIALCRNRESVSKSVLVLCTGFITVSAMTPFYQPYARLWLPVDAFCWLFASGWFVSIRWRLEIGSPVPGGIGGSATDSRRWIFPLCVSAALLIVALEWRQQRTPVLQPGDSLRLACQDVLAELPPDVMELGAYARPEVAFYLGRARDIAVLRQQDLTHLLEAGVTGSWALLDQALVRQDNIPERELEQLLDGWTTIKEIPTTLNAPTLLDIDPAAARGAKLDASAPLRLLRRK
jgi:hypothetical protein